MAASLNRAAFYAAVRTSLFGGRLKASQVAGMDAIFDAAPSLLGTTSLGYALATTFAARAYATKLATMPAREPPR